MEELNKNVEENKRDLSAVTGKAFKNQIDIQRNNDSIEDLYEANNENVERIAEIDNNVLVNRLDIKELERKQENDIKEVVSMQNAIAEQADKNKNNIQDLAKAQLAGVTVMEELNKNVEENKADIAANKADADESFETLTKNQNALAEQSEAQDALIAQNQTDITANKTAIEQNVNRTVVNGFEIEKNKAGIAKNQAEIVANKADADANFEALTKNQNTLIEQSEALTEQNKAINQELEGLAAYNELQDQYAKQQTDAIDALNKASSENTKRITTAELGIAENKKDAQIAKAQANENKADIAANKADADAKFKGVQTDIANNKTTLAEHTKKIDENQQAIEAKLGDKADLQKLAELKTSVDKNQAGIATNKQELIIQNNRLNRIDETNNRQDQKIDQLGYTLKEQGQYFNSRISAVERQTAGGIANAIAIATLPSPNRAGEHHVLFGSGYHNGQAAVSLGAAGSSDTGKSTYKIGLSWSDAGGLSGGVGGSYRWK